MNVRTTPLQGLLLIESDIHRDARGFFMESWHRQKYTELGIDADFVQDNVSASGRGVLRGLHFQNPEAQGKLVQVLEGEVFDVVVDLRRDSASFGRWHGEQLSAESMQQMYIPAGFAHGFCVTSLTAVFAYKCTAYYSAASEHAIRWNDPDLAIKWPVERPIVSDKDNSAPYLQDLDPAWLF